MREIEFRAKNLNDQWRYGYLERQDLLYDENYDCSSSIQIETLGQFTGRTDKNGTKIFEGDIVKLEEGLWEAKYNYVQIEQGECYEVYYDDKCARYDLKTEDENLEFKRIAWGQFVDGKVEVVGNIYDNDWENLKNGN